MIQFAPRSTQIAPLLKNQLLNAIYGNNRWSENHTKYINANCGRTF
jgi:hypothetical protein